MNNIRMGVVGVGNIGSAHADSINENKISNMSLTALCDTDKEMQATLREIYPNCTIFSDYTDMIDSGAVDAILVSVPHKFHAEIAEYALKNGVNVLVEKPVDITVSAAKRLNEIAANSGLVFGIMFNQRVEPIFKEAKRIISEGNLGELKRFVWIATNWYRSQEYYDSGDWRATWKGEGGGVLLNQAPHNLDMWQWLIGMPKSITAFCDFGKYHNIEVEDDVTIFARYKDGAVGTFIISTGEFPGTNRLEISGDLGKLVLENNTLKWWKNSKPERKFCFETERLSNCAETEYSEQRFENGTDNHIKIIQNFADAILNGAQLIAPGVDGIKELLISNAAYMSEWKGNIAIDLESFNSSEFDAFLAEKVRSSVSSDKKQCKKKHNGYNRRWNVSW